MKNGFLISIAVVLLSFSTIYLIVKDSNSANENPGLAPNAAMGCRNEKMSVKICAGDYICSAATPTGPVFMEIPPSGRCPGGYDLSTMKDAPQEVYCLAAQMIFKERQKTQSEPPACLPEGICHSWGVIDVPKGSSPNCCEFGKERVCEDRPLPTGGTSGDKQE